MSKAIGPSMVMKQPSKTPMIRQKTIIASYTFDPKWGATTSNMVHRPMETKETWGQKSSKVEC